MVCCETEAFRSRGKHHGNPDVVRCYLRQVELTHFAADVLSKSGGEGNHAGQLLRVLLHQLQVWPAKKEDKLRDILQTNAAFFH